MPDLILIDGGKGQLNAALGELEKLGLSNVPAIGLAKEFEEIHQANGMAPLSLGSIIMRLSCCNGCGMSRIGLRIHSMPNCVSRRFPRVCWMNFPEWGSAARLSC